MNETIRSILDRRSNRGYSENSISPEALELLKQCALASPTARNEQSWHFSFVTNRQLISDVERASIAAAEAKNDEFLLKITASRNGKIFYDAPLVVFISGDAGSKWRMVDAGIAAQNLALAAHSLGLGSVMIGLCGIAFEGEEEQVLSEKLGFPEGYKFSLAVCIGEPTVTKEAHPIKEGKICDIV